jgi:RNA polymerase sigma factor (sigma-70 family)
MKFSSIATYALAVVSVGSIFAADPPPWAYGFEGPPQAGATTIPVGPANTDQTPRSIAKARFREAFERLPERERKVAVLLYVYNLTLREIGEILGVTESRVCQIHGQITKKLRAELEVDEALFSEVA